MGLGGGYRCERRGVVMMEMRYDLHAMDFKLVLHIGFQSMLYEAKSHSDSMGYQSSPSL